MSPKSLLRHRRAISTMEELAEGAFQRIIPDDPAIDPGRVRRLVMCTGKIYYDLLERRDRDNVADVGILRVEQLYPLRPSELQARLAPYPKDVDLIWVQEEPWNMGAWYFMRARLPEILGDEQPLRCIARPESASPATGSRASHQMEQRLLIDEVFS
jgi:2-oxoglutarate dehydrogenase E1 component